jgi:hypothetical protein
LSGYQKLSNVTTTLVNHIWNCIKDDMVLKETIKSKKQIITYLPKETQGKSSQLSVFLYNVTELSIMRNQPQPIQDPSKPRTLIYLNLHYLITPLSHDSETDQLLLGRVIQLLAETPVLRGLELQGSLRESGDELRVALEPLGIDDLSKLWVMLSLPYRLCVGYSVQPIRIESYVKSEVTQGLVKGKERDKEGNRKKESGENIKDPKPSVIHQKK